VISTERTHPSLVGDPDLLAVQQITALSLPAPSAGGVWTVIG
jgi:hypothetical protein